MEWIEVIRISSAENRQAMLEDKITSMMKQLNAKEPNHCIKLYRSLSDEDMSIYLYWNKGNPEHQGSKTGRCLAHLLKEFGFISHSAWVERKV
ncbi:MAG: hypothetical protein ACXU9G_09195 [Syntrophales bacterium]